jgi:hypothetical protein
LGRPRFFLAGRLAAAFDIYACPKEARMADAKTRPFLINKDEDGNFRLTVRTIRYNSQGYPLVDAALQEELFKTAAAAKAFARDNFRAQPGEYATK